MMHKISGTMGVPFSSLDSITKDITRRSCGVFLWVKLVITELEQMAAQGCTPGDLQDLLDILPGELNNIYDRIILKLVSLESMRSHELSRLMFRWVALSEWPLSLIELDEALAFSLCGSPATLEELRKNRSLNLQNATRRILGSSGGFLEIVEGKVQFIHQTVREYLFELPASSPWSISREHGFIRQACLDYTAFAATHRRSRCRRRIWHSWRPKSQRHHSSRIIRHSASGA